MNDAPSSVATLGPEPTVTKARAQDPVTGTRNEPPQDSARPTVDVSKLPKIRRRQYVLDRRRQYRTAILTSGLATILLVIVNTAFTILRDSQTSVIAAAAPQLESSLSAQDSRVGMILIVVSVIFVIGIFVITIAETHRTAGAVYAMGKAIDRVADGDFWTPLRLRPNDNLSDLRAPFNEMISTLRKTALADADELEKLARAVQAGEIDTSSLAEKLAALAAEKREVGGPSTQT